MRKFLLNPIVPGLLCLLLLVFAGCSADKHTLKGYLSEVKHGSTNMAFITLKFEGGATVDVFNHNSVPLFVGQYQEIEIGKNIGGCHHDEYTILSNVSPTYEHFVAVKRQQDLTAEYEKQLAAK